MHDAISESLAVIRQDMEKLHQAFQQDEVLRQTIVFRLAKILADMDLIAVPSWKPPRSTRDRIDLVGAVPGTDPPEIMIAFVVDPFVELPKIKAMEWVSCEEKVVVTFSPRREKVNQSTFFLSPDMDHINLFE